MAVIHFIGIVSFVQLERRSGGQGDNPGSATSTDISFSLNSIENSESFIFTVHYGSHEVQNRNLSRPRLAEVWISLCSAQSVTSNAQ